MQASPGTVRKMLQLLKDGRFLDESSDMLRGRFVTYNEPLQSFATVELEFSRGSDGAFSGKVQPVSCFVSSLLCLGTFESDWSVARCSNTWKLSALCT